MSLVEHSTPARRPVGRPTLCTDAMTEEFCARIAAGRSVASVCRDADMPAQETIYDWLLAGSSRFRPDFAQKLADARAVRTDRWAEDIRDLGDQVLTDESIDPARARVAVDAIDKAAKLMAPKKLELSGPNGSPLVDPAALVQSLAAYMREREGRAEIRATAEDLPVLDAASDCQSQAGK